MKALLLLFTICFSFTLFAQYQVGHTTITFNDPARSGGTGSGGGAGRQIQTEIYYPAATTGDNVAVVAGQFPVITFGHGFAMSWDAYSNIWQRYAAKGYILAFPRTEGGLIPAPSHGDFGTDLRQVAEKMLALNSNVSSIFNGKVLQKAIIMGHSMGGGATMLAGANNSNIVGVVGLAPAETNPSAITAAPNVSVPALIFSGTADGVTPPAEHHIPIYTGLVSSCKNFVNITGGGHCYYAQTNFNCDFGESTSSPNISIERAAQQQLTYTLLDPWLDFILKDNCDSYTTFQSVLSSTTGTIGQTTCSTVPNVSINGNAATLMASTTGVSYQWYINGSPINGATNQSFTATINGDYTVKVTFDFGCAVSSPYTFSSGTNDIEEMMKSIQMFPNPAKDFIIVKNNSGLETSYRIFDLNGRILMETTSVSTEFQLDLIKFQKGNYLIQIGNLNGRKITKLVKD